MPTVLKDEGYRFYFYSNEAHEPPHVHVDKAGATVKLWPHPIAVAAHAGFNARDLSYILRLARRHRRQILDAWHEHFSRST